MPHVEFDFVRYTQYRGFDLGIERYDSPEDYPHEYQFKLAVWKWAIILTLQW